MLNAPGTNTPGRAAVLGGAVLWGIAACSGTPDIAGGDSRGPWFANDPESTMAIDHAPWDSFIAAWLETDPHGDGVNRVAYGAVTEEDHRKLKAYLRSLEQVDIAKYDRDQQVAFWMNLYNAAMADTVLDAMPVSSVLQIRGPGTNVVGPWLRPVARIYGKPLTFDDIEHRILRVGFNDMGPPIHYGVNCASMGCPPLAPRAHTAENWRRNLAEAARQFVNCPHGVRFDDDGALHTSRIYRSWFQEDFGGSDESVIAHLMDYAEPALAERLRGRTAIADDFYDWRLNALRTGEPRPAR